MKKNIYTFLLLFTISLVFLSCEKEEPKECPFCWLVTESNSYEAQRRCNAVANNWPFNYDEVGRINIGVVCNPASVTLQNTHTQQCAGITTNIRQRLECD